MTIKGGWARFRKQQQQQQESTVSQPDDNEYQVHEYRNIISSKHMNENINSTTLASTVSTPSPFSATSPLSIKGCLLQVDQGDIRASKLLQILRRWKTVQSTKQIVPCPHRRSTTSSTPCSKLNFVPLSCITFSSIQLSSDHEEEEDDDDDAAGNDMNIASDSDSKNAKSPARPPLHHQSRSAHTAQISGYRPTAVKNTQCKEIKKRDSFCERKVRGLVRRELSCPKLSSPLNSCTAFPSMEADEEEELERLQPKEEEAGRMKLRRSSSSPLRRSSSSPLRWHSMLSKQHSIPKGYLALYVGEERRRFLVKANVLNHPLFTILLEKAKEEFGFHQQGPLNIPCEISFFQHIMFLVESNDPSSTHADHI